jgi:hypothetical protein
VTFTNVLRGDYKIYIVANYDGNLATNYPKGSSSLTGLQKHVLGEISDGTSPTYAPANGVPASLEMDVSVAPGNNVISAHLKRAVGRLSIAFRNMTEHDLYVGDMSLSAYNPSQGYLFSKNHSLPGTSQYRAFPSLSGDPVKIGNETVVFDHYLYETGYPSSPFELAFDAGLYTAGTSPTYESTNVQSVDVKPGANMTSVPDGDDIFMIHSKESPRFYLGADDSGLVCTEFGSDENIVNSAVVDNYLWRKSGNSIINIGTGKFLSIYPPGVSINSTTVSFSDILAVLKALEMEISRAVLSGSAVKLGYLGSFFPTISAKSQPEAEKVDATTIKKFSCRFLPSSSFKHSLAKVKYQEADIEVKGLVE